MDSLELSSPVFSILTGLIEEKAGLHYEPTDRDIIRERASARAVELGFDSLLDYYYYLRYDAGGAQELAELIESLVVGETYFFREWRAIEVLIDSFVAPWCADGRRPRIWSAACATGEEPLSLAMGLEDRGLLSKVEIVATDISRRALDRAKRGRFSRRSVRRVPEPGLLESHLRTEDGAYVVSPRLLETIQWQRKNLLSPEELSALGLFDAILCRNVLIYFSDATVKTVIDQLWRSLVPGGLLLVGVSESLLRYGSGFDGEEHGGTFIYRKPRA